MSRWKLSHWFAIWLMAMLILVVVTQPESRPDKLGTIDFATTESAELYFRNVKAYHYHHRQEAGDIFDVYRLKALFDQPVANLPWAIYHNWRANEAFIRLDSSFVHLPWEAALCDSLGTMYVIPLPYGDNESQYLFAVVLYRAIRDEHPAALVNSQGDTLWITGEERKAVRRVLGDYFRLVGRL